MHDKLPMLVAAYYCLTLDRITMKDQEYKIGNVACKVGERVQVVTAGGTVQRGQFARLDSKTALVLHTPTGWVFNERMPTGDLVSVVRYVEIGL